MAKKRVYIESSVISYLTARLSRDPLRKARQQITRIWWTRRDQFQLFVSQAVVDEIRDGDPDAARKRLEAISELPMLPPSEASAFLTGHLVSEGAVPVRALEDAAHIALAAVNRMDFLLTWNHTHIANAAKMADIRSVILRTDHRPPLIVTPEYMLEENHGE